MGKARNMYAVGVDGDVLLIDQCVAEAIDGLHGTRQAFGIIGLGAFDYRVLTLAPRRHRLGAMTLGEHRFGAAWRDHRAGCIVAAKALGVEEGDFGAIAELDVVQSNGEMTVVEIAGELVDGLDTGHHAVA